MLNPPLSLLSEDLIGYLVEHVARLGLAFANRALHNLSLTDPAFTEFCQKYIFRTLTLGAGGTSLGMLSTRLKNVKRILDDKPSFADRVRKIQLLIGCSQNAWVFQNPSSEDLRRKDAPYGVTFINILQLLANSPMPPHELYFEVGLYPIEDPILVVRQLSQSFFSHTLTILHLTECNDLPLPPFLLCPRLKEVHLDGVQAGEESYDKYPDEQCSGREPPALEFFDCSHSETVIRQMITPPPRFHTPVVLWSKLRVLALTLNEGEELACLRPILDVACTTLEELYLTASLNMGSDKQLSFNGLVRLRAFALYTIIKCDAPESAVLHTTNSILGTIPASNIVTNLSFDFYILGEEPFHGCLDENWVGMCDEVIRISSGKPLELDINMLVGLRGRGHRCGEDELYMHIRERTTSLSDHPNICTHFWNPGTHRSITRLHYGEVRSRCRE